MSLFSCPICGDSLSRTGATYRCHSNHSFDISSEGYTYLLPANKKHSKMPGDDKTMVNARRAFLQQGYYAPLADALGTLTQALRSKYQDIMDFTYLDSGCGEGYYTKTICDVLSASFRPFQAVGIDISKFAVRLAAKQLKDRGEFAVASVYHLPIADASIDLLTNIFSPLCIDEFSRVLKPGGHFVYVVPSALHLWELKEVLYQNPYENPVKVEEYPSFQWLRAIPVRGKISLADSEQIMALLQMTPYAWKTPKQGIEALQRLTNLETQIGFDLHIYQKTSVH